MTAFQPLQTRISTLRFFLTGRCGHSLFLCDQNMVAKLSGNGWAELVIESRGN